MKGSIAQNSQKNPKSFSFPENIARNGVGRVIQEETPCWPEGDKRLFCCFLLSLVLACHWLFGWCRCLLLVVWLLVKMIDLLELGWLLACHTGKIGGWGERLTVYCIFLCNNNALVETTRILLLQGISRHHTWFCCSRDFPTS